MLFWYRFSMCLVILTMPAFVLALDVIPIPPVERAFCSQNSEYCVQITRPEQLNRDQWPELTITHENGSNTPSVHQLGYRYGPRFVSVLDSGFVVTFDEWFLLSDIPSAIQIFNANGAEVITYSSDEVLAVSGHTEEEAQEVLVKAGNWGIGNLGSWLASEPKISEDNTKVLFTVGHSILVLDFSNPEPKLRVGGETDILPQSSETFLTRIFNRLMTFLRSMF